MTLDNKEKGTFELQSSGVEEVKNPVANLDPKMQRFVHLYMTGQYSLSKLAELLDVHPNTVTNWLRRKEIKGVIAEMQELTHEVVGTQMKAMTMKALSRMRELMDSPIDGVALQAVKDVLDRSGHKAKQEIKVDKTVVTYEERLNDLISEVIIDAEFEEAE